MSVWAPGKKLRDIGDQAVLECMAYYCGHRSRVARALGISARGLFNRLRELERRGIEITRPPVEEYTAPLHKRSGYPSKEEG